MGPHGLGFRVEGLGFRVEDVRKQQEIPKSS